MSYIISQDSRRIQDSLSAANSRRSLAQSVANAYVSETSSEPEAPELTMELLDHIIHDPSRKHPTKNKLYQIAMDLLPEVSVGGVTLKKESLEQEPIAFTATRAAVEYFHQQVHVKNYGKQVGGCYLMDGSYQLSVDPAWQAQIEAQATKRAVTEVEQYVFDQLEAIREIVEETHERTGFKINIQEMMLHTPGVQFRPMEQRFNRVWRTRRAVDVPTELEAVV